MKKGFLLGLASILLHSAIANAQEPFVPPTPAPFAPPTQPLMVEQAPGELMYGPLRASSTFRGEPRWWITSDFLLWTTRNAPVNTPLVAQSLSTTDPTAGAIGSANTRVVLGNQALDLGTRYGIRVTLGGWFSVYGALGVEGNYLYLQPRSTTQSVGTSGAPGSPELTLPYRDASTGMETFAALAGPNGFGAPASGSAFLTVRNVLQGGEFNLIGKLITSDTFSITGLAGFRYVRFDEDLDFGGSLTAPGNQAFSWRDSFHANNNFYGGQFGLRTDWPLGRFTLSATGKIAIGTINQSMDIRGSSSGTNFPGTFTTNTGGFYALSTNIGSYNRNEFAFIPECEVKLGYNLTQNLQAFVGYNFLYINNVARPGTAIDHSINTTQSQAFGGTPGGRVGPAAPNFGFSRSDFFAQGLTVGLQFRY